MALSFALAFNPILPYLCGVHTFLAPGNEGTMSFQDIGNCVPVDIT